jgi:hypothetical protein
MMQHRRSNLATDALLKSDLNIEISQLNSDPILTALSQAISPTSRTNSALFMILKVARAFITSHCGDFFKIFDPGVKFTFDYPSGKHFDILLFT